MPITTLPPSSNKLAYFAKKRQVAVFVLGFVFLTWFFVPDHTVSVYRDHNGAITVKRMASIRSPPQIHAHLYTAIRNWSCFSNQIQLRLWVSGVSSDRHPIPFAFSKENRVTLRPFTSRNVGISAFATFDDELASQMEQSETLLILSSRRDDVDEWKRQDVQRIPPKKYPLE